MAELSTQGLDGLIDDMTALMELPDETVLEMLTAAAEVVAAAQQSEAQSMGVYATGKTAGSISYDKKLKVKGASRAIYLSFSKLLCYGVLLIDYKTTSTTLDLCYIAVANNYTGSLPYLTALIALLQAATATVLSFALNKSKAENTAGGIVYETTLKRDC